MEKNLKNNNLLSYKEWGYGKIAKCIYEFLITDDYQASISITVCDEIHKAGAATSSVALDEQERQLVDLFVARFIEPEKKKQQSFDELDIPYEGISIESFDYKIVDNYWLKGKLQTLKDVIQGDHPELSFDSVVDMYNHLCDQIGVVSTTKMK